MSALRLPSNASSMLDRAQVSGTTPEKWLIYNIASECSANDTWELFQKAVVENPGYAPEEDELEQVGWCWPAETNGREVSSLQEVVDFHFAILSKMIAGEATGQKHLVYVYGFLAITSSGWREKGVTAASATLTPGQRMPLANTVRRFI